MGGGRRCPFLFSCNSFSDSLHDCGFVFRLLLVVNAKSVEVLSVKRKEPCAVFCAASLLVN